MSTKTIVDENITKSINAFHEPKSTAYCSGCAPDLTYKYKLVLDAKKMELSKKIKKLIGIISIVTTHTPAKWDYDVLEIVTSQSVTGTGMFSEIASSWADIVGGQSNSLSAKLVKGENLCKDQLRYKCALLGGNAIIAADLDYAEVGGAKGMLMVCMAGTAVKINNVEMVKAGKSGDFLALDSLIQELKSLEDIKLDISW